ncbi:hypothetical protein HanPI659440_Chr01g0012271 [Helianthus annuus]|nr:hypothetical protein HanPI659440_Chr06g0245191 [Helianthus annuus]KAJ0809217.1 hypothetical protein HanPI659440_Chr01g0012271 [Helianthus annuus]
MAEKIYPAAKPSGAPPPAATTGNPTFPATKAQLYNNSRPVYRPQPRRSPTFSVSALHVTQFNLTSANKLNSRFNFTVTARNPNKKIVFYYDLVSVSFDSNGVNVGDGTI